VTISCGDAVTTIGVAVTEGLLFCFFVLPTSTTGELLVGVAVALAGEAFDDDPNIHQPFSLRVASSPAIRLPEEKRREKGLGWHSEAAPRPRLW